MRKCCLQLPIMNTSSYGHYELITLYYWCKRFNIPSAKNQIWLWSVFNHYWFKTEHVTETVMGRILKSADLSSSAGLLLGRWQCHDSWSSHFSWYYDRVHCHHLTTQQSLYWVRRCVYIWINQEDSFHIRDFYKFLLIFFHYADSIWCHVLCVCVCVLLVTQEGHYITLSLSIQGTENNLPLIGFWHL